MRLTKTNNYHKKIFFLTYEILLFLVFILFIEILFSAALILEFWLALLTIFSSILIASKFENHFHSIQVIYLKKDNLENSKFLVFEEILKHKNLKSSNIVLQKYIIFVLTFTFTIFLNNSLHTDFQKINYFCWGITLKIQLFFVFIDFFLLTPFVIVFYLTIKFFDWKTNLKTLYENINRKIINFISFLKTKAIYFKNKLEIIIKKLLAKQKRKYDLFQKNIIAIKKSFNLKQRNKAKLPPLFSFNFKY